VVHVCLDNVTLNSFLFSFVDFRHDVLVCYCYGCPLEMYSYPD
jgi:hypothetical protein